MRSWTRIRPTLSPARRPFTGSTSRSHGRRSRPSYALEDGSRFGGTVSTTRKGRTTFPARRSRSTSPFLIASRRALTAQATATTGSMRSEGPDSKRPSDVISHGRGRTRPTTSSRSTRPSGDTRPSDRRAAAFPRWNQAHRRRRLWRRDPASVRDDPLLGAKARRPALGAESTARAVFFAATVPAGLRGRGVGGSPGVCAHLFERVLSFRHEESRFG